MRSMLATSRRRSKAFTLVELLVVIGIIALLISILLPALAKARLAAMLVLEGSNMRQVFLGVAQYANDNRNRLPGGSDCYQWDTNTVRIRLFKGNYLTGSFQRFPNGAEVTGSDYSGTSPFVGNTPYVTGYNAPYTEVWGCPLQRDLAPDLYARTWWWPSPQTGCPDAKGSLFIVQRFWGAPWEVGGRPWTDEVDLRMDGRGWLPWNAIDTKPYNIVLLTDATGAWYYALPNHGAVTGAAGGCPKSSNSLFLDGHVELRQPWQHTNSGGWR